MCGVALRIGRSRVVRDAKGAFTGAHASRVGRFEQANRSSIFFDEIGELPRATQPKLLRVLQEQEIQRVGCSETVRVDVRVIAASNVDLEEAVRERRFREDLFYRLNVVSIHLPPLRERREDIPLLIDHFLEKMAQAESTPKKQIDAEAQMFLMNRDWPGNIRQLEHHIQRAVVLSGSREVLKISDFAALGSGKPEQGGRTKLPLVFFPRDGVNSDETVGNLERSLIEQALAVSQGNRARAADLLQIKRTTLLAKMKVLNVRSSGPQLCTKSAIPFEFPASSRSAAPGKIETCGSSELETDENESAACCA
ncbi:MAG TPA: sigma 54-interacting transcriptional regulator [Bryobacteraceae bacterium]|nr:sigma 54-interacting transcriptional regulator [Bryobacteraceae bacterium]